MPPANSASEVMDIFRNALNSRTRVLAISHVISGAGTILILRSVGADGKVVHVEKYATGLDHPFGIAFYPAENPEYVYVGNATTIQRLPYHTGDLHATGAPETPRRIYGRQSAADPSRCLFEEWSP